MIDQNLPMKTIIENFISHVENMESKLENGKDLYDSEFQELKNITDSLKAMQYYAASEGVKIYNRRKNRYKDILPFDVTRVVLSPLIGVDGSDYINANYIRGASGSQAYIAAQGPLASTVEDFWRMVVECDVQVIIMACNETESGRLKCENYWPDGKSGNTTLQCGEIGVTLIQWRSICDDFSVRKLAVRYRDRKKCTQESRVVCQFHYTAWPDHGVPASVEPLLLMMRMVRETQASETLPVLVHCSAGCGRTGCICAIDFVWGLLRAGGLRPTFSLFDLVAEMRRQRVAMVQTKDQYTLVHRAVCHLFMEQLHLIDNHPYANLPLTPAGGVENPQQQKQLGTTVVGDIDGDGDGGRPVLAVSTTAPVHTPSRKDDRAGVENVNVQPFQLTPASSASVSGGAGGSGGVRRQCSLRLAPPLPDKRRSLSAVPPQLVPPAAAARHGCSRAASMTSHGAPLTFQTPARRLARSHSSVSVDQRRLVPVSRTVAPLSTVAVNSSESQRVDRRYGEISGGVGRQESTGVTRRRDSALCHSMSELSVSKAASSGGEQACHSITSPTIRKGDEKEGETERVVCSNNRSMQLRQSNSASTVFSSPITPTTNGQSSTLVGVVKPRPRLIAPPPPLPPPPPPPPAYPGVSRGSVVQPRRHPVRRSRSLKLTPAALAPAGPYTTGPDYLALEEPGAASVPSMARVAGPLPVGERACCRREVSASQPARLDAIGRYERRLVHCSRQLGLNDTLDEQQQHQQLQLLAAGDQEKLLSPSLVALISGHPTPSVRKARTLHSYDNFTPLAVDSRQCIEQQLRRNPRAGVYDVTSSGGDRAVAALRCTTRPLYGERRASFRRAVLGSSQSTDSCPAATTTRSFAVSPYTTVTCSSSAHSSSTSSLSSASLASLPTESTVSERVKTSIGTRLACQTAAAAVMNDARERTEQTDSSETPVSGANAPPAVRRPVLSCFSVAEDRVDNRMTAAPSDSECLSPGASQLNSSSTAVCSAANTCVDRVETPAGPATSSVPSISLGTCNILIPRCVGKSVFYGTAATDSGADLFAVSMSPSVLSTPIQPTSAVRTSTSAFSTPSLRPVTSTSSTPSTHLVTSVSSYASAYHAPCMSSIASSCPASSVPSTSFSRPVVSPSSTSSRPVVSPLSAPELSPVSPFSTLAHPAVSPSSTPSTRSADRLLISQNSAFRPYRHVTAETSRPAAITAPPVPATITAPPVPTTITAPPVPATITAPPVPATTRKPAAITAHLSPDTTGSRKPTALVPAKFTAPTDTDVNHGVSSPAGEGELRSVAVGDAAGRLAGGGASSSNDAANRYKSDYAVVHRTFINDMVEVPTEKIACGLRPTAPPRSKRASCSNMLQMANRRFSLSQPYLCQTGRPTSLMIDSCRRIESDNESIPPQVPVKTTASYQIPTPDDCSGAAITDPIRSDISPNHHRSPTENRPAVRSLLGRLQNRAASFRARVAGWAEPALSSVPGAPLLEKSNPGSWQAYV